METLAMAESDYSFVVEERQNGTRNGNMWGPFSEDVASVYRDILTRHVSKYGDNYNLTYQVRYLANRVILPYTGEEL